MLGNSALSRASLALRECDEISHVDIGGSPQSWLQIMAAWWRVVGRHNEPMSGRCGVTWQISGVVWPQNSFWYGLWLGGNVPGLEVSLANFSQYLAVDDGIRKRSAHPCQTEWRPKIAADLRLIYQSAIAEEAELWLGEFEEEWEAEYLPIGQSWWYNWPHLIDLPPPWISSIIRWNMFLQQSQKWLRHKSRNKSLWHF